MERHGTEDLVGGGRGPAEVVKKVRKGGIVPGLHERHVSQRCSQRRLRDFFPQEFQPVAQRVTTL